MQIELHYGQTTLPLRIPEANCAGLIIPRQEQAHPGRNRELLSAAIQTSQAVFQNHIRARRLCVLLPDATRDLPVADCLTAIACQLQEAASIRFILCTGTHPAKTQSNLALCDEVRQICRAAGLRGCDILIHDCQDADFIDAGTTQRDTAIRYNAAIRDGEIFLVLSDVKPHYFAGYSNPVKNFVPGICDYETARGNHSLTLDAASGFCAHPYHPNPARQSQPLAADQVEAMDKIVQGRPVYALTTISSHRAIQWAAFDPIREVCAKAFVQADQWNLHTVRPVERLIVSPGGHPNDMDMYIAQRALELTEQAVSDGGEILFCAACQHGIGPANSMDHFWNLLVLPLEDIYQSIEGQYKMFSHKPYRFAKLIQRLRQLCVYSELPDDQIQAAHMQPTHNPQQVVDGWLRENPDVQILVVDGANKVGIKKT
ncbi:MAG: lactate racemase domain-containing protein [Anaerohalosphaeraceae bacterium]